MPKKKDRPVPPALFMTVRDAAARLDISEREAWRKVSTGTIPSVKIGRL